MRLDKFQAALVERLQPGVLTQRGFLGHDGRDLARIIEEDDVSVRSLGLTHLGVAARMRYLAAHGKAGFGDPVCPNGRHVITYREAMGGAPCPWGDCPRVPNAVIRVQNEALDREVTFTELSVHLIGAHGFYQGRGSPFRLDPFDLRDVLW